MHDETKDSQQEPEQDSALQTPQPDQPHPPVSNRREDLPEDSPPIQTDLPVAPADQAESD